MKPGEIYRLKFPWIGWVRVLPNPPDTTVTMADGTPGYLVETLFTKSRWWCTAQGWPNNHASPCIHVTER